MEEQLLLSKQNSQRIMSIDVRLDEFDRQGNLTSIGKNNFWREVDRVISIDRGTLHRLEKTISGEKSTE